MPDALICQTPIYRLVHDLADGACAAPAFGAAAQAPVHFAGAARRTFSCDRPDLMVGNHVARTHDHGGTPCSDRPRGSDFWLQMRPIQRPHFLGTRENSSASAMI